MHREGWAFVYLWRQAEEIGGRWLAGLNAIHKYEWVRGIGQCGHPSKRHWWGRRALWRNLHLSSVILCGEVVIVFSVNTHNTYTAMEKRIELEKRGRPAEEVSKLIVNREMRLISVVARLRRNYCQQWPACVLPGGTCARSPTRPLVNPPWSRAVLLFRS